MKHKVAIGDSVEIAPEGYFVLRQKGYSVPFTMVLHQGDDDKIKKVARLPDKALALLFLMMQHIGYDKIVRLSVGEVMSLLAVRRAQAYRALQALKEVDMVRRVGKDAYRLDPQYVWRGSAKERAEAVQEWNAHTQEKGS